MLKKINRFKRPRIDLEKLVEFAEAEGSFHISGWWKEYIVCGSHLPRQSSDPENAKLQSWINRFDLGVQTNWCPHFSSEFPEICQVLKQLPFQRITVCNMLMQIAEVLPHIDIDERCDVRSPYIHEMDSYKWQMNFLNEKSFYVESDYKRVYPEFGPDDSGIFVIDQRNAKHGAHYVGRKIIMSIFGVLDFKSHKKLIEQAS